MPEIFFASLLLGAFAGIAAGLFGIGGGALIVPVLVWLFRLQQFDPEQIMLLAVATSLATAIFTSMASVRSHYLLGNIDSRRALRLAPTMLLGASGGAVLAELFNADMLRWFFVSYLLYTCGQLLRPPKTVSSPHSAKTYLDYPMSLLIGILSAILGIGGGTMTVPYLAGNGLIMKKAVATSSACAIPIALAGAASYAILGWRDDHLPNGSLGYLYLPAFAGIVLTSVFTAPIGARLAHRLPAQRLKRYFAIVLFLIAIKMAG
ncbi:sulfite exporter TauE/SafE family protein [Methylomonas sp. SURF-2]|uniref:Probable membrane transporter protein n=1 Tax=Methylomonas subterranea TaxID=2952225 RepID=A0ABT1TK17_9GAMM|nr:sulfite exporter TauE/SafE family protein [Methylomonas sp. SURF-2]MCQ8105816.1 sulfite exporter TauE/SafE family protein [Methylomonas sp. SURF-2]